MVILDIIMEGTMSQIFYLGPSSFFNVILKMMLRIFTNSLPIFGIKSELRP